MRLIDADALRNRMYRDAFETDTDMQRWDSGCWIRYKLFENAINEQPTIEPKQEWIPCSERLPELGENVLVTLMFNDYRDIGIYTRQWTSDRSEIRWFSDDEYGQLFDCDIVAWMPLPKPWEGADE